MDIFSTKVLNRTIEYLNTPSSFLLDTFFPTVQTEESEEIHFDIDDSKPRLAPFVSPLVAGKVVANEGFTTKSFKPAYVKDKRRFNANLPLKRAIGEQIGGSMAGADRMQIAINRALSSQLDNLTRREEVMAAEALVHGQITVAGENYPTQVVNFARDTGLSITITPANAKWGGASAKPVDDLEDWATLIQEKSGAVARTVVMDPQAWRLFRKNAVVKELLDMRGDFVGTQNNMSTEPIARGQGNEKARFVGMLGDFSIYVYNDIYIDDAGATQKLLPDNTVILASTGQLEGVRCYGMIQDHSSSFGAQRYYSKSWIEEDPSVRWLLLQSAPLVVPYRPNASLRATVA